MVEADGRDYRTRLVRLVADYPLTLTSLACWRSTLQYEGTWTLMTLGGEEGIGRAIG